MNARFSRLFLAGGQNAVPLSGWFLGGGTPASKKGGLAGTRSKDESFSDYWQRTQAEDASRFARDEEVMEHA